MQTGKWPTTQCQEGCTTSTRLPRKPLGIGLILTNQLRNPDCTRYKAIRAKKNQLGDNELHLEGPQRQHTIRLCALGRFSET